MKSTIILLSFIIGIAQPTYSIAQGAIGSGGGKAIVCFSTKEAAENVRKNGHVVSDALISKIRSMDSLDLDNARMSRTFQNRRPQLIEATKDQQLAEFLDVLVGRLKNLYSEVGEKVLEKEGSLFSNVFLRINPLIQLNDENEVGSNDSDYCTTTTIAVQFQELDTTYIHLDSRLFFHPQFSITSQASILLHEYIYSVLRESGVTDSRLIRIMVGKVFEKAHNDI